MSFGLWFVPLSLFKIFCSVLYILQFIATLIFDYNVPYVQSRYTCPVVHNSTIQTWPPAQALTAHRRPSTSKQTHEKHTLYVRIAMLRFHRAFACVIYLSFPRYTLIHKCAVLPASEVVRGWAFASPLPHTAICYDPAPLVPRRATGRRAPSYSHDLWTGASWIWISCMECQCYHATAGNIWADRRTSTATTSETGHANSSGRVFGALAIGS